MASEEGSRNLYDATHFHAMKEYLVDGADRNSDWYGKLVIINRNIVVRVTPPTASPAKEERHKR